MAGDMQTKTDAPHSDSPNHGYQGERESSTRACTEATSRRIPMPFRSSPITMTKLLRASTATTHRKRASTVVLGM